MAEEIKEPKEEKELSKEERKEALKGKSKGGTTSNIDFAKQLATRQKLERDYEEDRLYITFYSSPETKRTILARKPNQEEFLEILTLTIESAKYEGKMDIDSLGKMKDIVQNLNKLAAELSVDKQLDAKFWSTKVSFNTLQNFIAELINESQKGQNLKEDDMKSFRRK